MTTTLGFLVDKTAGRDAIHIAVAPVIAGERIAPGGKVEWADTTKTTVISTWDNDEIGVADPFLKSPVSPGDRFYVLLNQNSITGLRHVWTHPDFEPETALPETLTAAEESEQWLRNFLHTHDAPSYDTLMKAVEDVRRPEPDESYGEFYAVWDDGFATFLGEAAHCQVPPEFWHHVETVLGRPLDPRKKVPAFSCSC